MKELENGTIILTREELYERVWTTAMHNMAPHLGVSDVGLAKICKRFDIPTPPRGYWAKKEHGKAPKRPRLPQYDDPNLEGIKFYPTAASYASRPAGQLEEYEQREAADENRIVVPEQLGSPHPLVDRTLKSLLSSRKGEDGLVRPGAKRTLNVQVTPQNMDRAMRLMDALLKALEARSLPVALEVTDTGTSTVVTVLDEAVHIGLHGIVKRQERAPTPAEKHDMVTYPSLYGNKRYFEEVPTGQLCLAVLSGPANGRKHRYTDTERRPVERLLNAFVICLYRTAEDIKAERVRLEDLRRQREEAERQRREWEKVRWQKLEEIRKEEERLKVLLQQTESWRRSQDLRQFIRAFEESRRAANGEVQPGSDAAMWIDWARQHADRLDPRVKSPPSILDEKSKWERSSYW